MLPATTPPQTPAEVVQIDPESLEIANLYTSCGSPQAVSDQLGVPLDQVVTTLRRVEVKSYVDYLFQSTGFNNRVKIRKAMDLVLERKFQELDEGGASSTKDIADLLALSHKMTMEHLDREIALEKLRLGNGPGFRGPKSQVNVQINEHAPGGTNYSTLLDRLMKGT